MNASSQRPFTRCGVSAKYIFTAKRSRMQAFITFNRKNMLGSEQLHFIKILPLNASSGHTFLQNPMQHNFIPNYMVGHCINPLISIYFLLLVWQKSLPVIGNAVRIRSSSLYCNSYEPLMHN